MSLRTTGYIEKYGRNQPRGGGGSSESDGPGFIPKLFGKDRVKGGLSATPEGKMAFTPYQGSGGLLGSWSRGRATELNALYGPLMLAMQHEKELSTQESTQRMAEMQKGNELAISLANNAQFNAQLDKLGIPTDPSVRQEVIKSLVPTMLENLQLKGGMEQAALKDPASQEMYTRGMQSGFLKPEVTNRASLAAVVPQGGTGYIPSASDVTNRFQNGPPSGLSVTGATQQYRTAGGYPMMDKSGNPIIDPSTGQPLMMNQTVIPTSIPGGVYGPIKADPNIIGNFLQNSNMYGQLPPSGGGDWTGGTGRFGDPSASPTPTQPKLNAAPGFEPSGIIPTTWKANVSNPLSLMKSNIDDSIANLIQKWWFGGAVQ